MESPRSAVASSPASTKSADPGPQASADRLGHAAPGNLEVGIAREGAGRRHVEVDDGPRVPGLHLGDGLVGGRHDHVAADDGVRLARGDAHRVDVLRPRGDADVRVDRAALLREARHVEDGDALALDVRGHAQERADGDHAGAADAGDQDSPGPLERRQGRLGERRGAACATGLRLRSFPPSTVTKLGQKPLTQEKSLLQVLWSIARLRPNSVSTGTIDRQFDFSPQSPQPSQTRSLMTTRRAGSGNVPRLRRRRFSAAQVWS